VVEDRTEPPIVHFVGSIPLPDAETVFRRLAQTTGHTCSIYLAARPASAKPGYAFCNRSPSAANSRASASPMPWAPPVTDATMSLRRMTEP
jgi:hypothetical protein